MIYAEIPEANAWLTGLGVVLGVGQFGLAGVVLGPLLASVPLICCLQCFKSRGEFLLVVFWGKELTCRLSHRFVACHVLT